MAGALAAAAGAGGLRVSLAAAASVAHIVVDPINAIAGIRLDADGKIYALQGGGATVQGDWIVPNGAAGAAYEARATVTAGALTTGTTGSWLALNADREWRCTRAGVGVTTATITLEIRAAGFGTVLAAKAGIVISADVD